MNKRLQSCEHEGVCETEGEGLEVLVYLHVPPFNGEDATGLTIDVQGKKFTFSFQINWMLLD